MTGISTETINALHENVALGMEQEAATLEQLRLRLNARQEWSVEEWNALNSAIFQLRYEAGRRRRMISEPAGD